MLTELPPKTEQTVEVELDARHARSTRPSCNGSARRCSAWSATCRSTASRSSSRSRVLRQLALDPALVDDTHDAVGSAKLDRLLDDLTQVVAEGHRALVFSQFTRFLGRLRARLDDAGIDHSLPRRHAPAIATEAIAAVQGRRRARCSSSASRPAASA